jgi:hypothetical protein
MRNLFARKASFENLVGGRFPPVSNYFHGASTRVVTAPRAIARPRTHGDFRPALRLASARGDPPCRNLKEQNTTARVLATRGAP